MKDSHNPRFELGIAAAQETLDVLERFDKAMNQLIVGEGIENMSMNGSREFPWIYYCNGKIRIVDLGKFIILPQILIPINLDIGFYYTEVLEDALMIKHNHTKENEMINVLEGEILITWLNGSPTESMKVRKGQSEFIRAGDNHSVHMNKDSKLITIVYPNFEAI